MSVNTVSVHRANIMNGLGIHKTAELVVYAIRSRHDLLVANDTQPNKLYRNQRNGTFKDVAVEAGLAFSTEGKARAGMGVDVGNFNNSGRAGIAITNFDNEMISW